MTTALAPSLPFRVYQPDILISTIHLKLPKDQMDYLNVNKEMDRPQLFKAFRKKFNSKINKLQLNNALERITEELIKEKSTKPPSVLARYERPDVPKERNIHWIIQQGVWEVKFIVSGKSVRLGRYLNLEKAKKVAEEYRKNLA